MRKLNKMTLEIQNCNMIVKVLLITLSALAIYYAGKKTGEFIYYIIN